LSFERNDISGNGLKGHCASIFAANLACQCRFPGRRELDFIELAAETILIMGSRIDGRDKFVVSQSPQSIFQPSPIASRLLRITTSYTKYLIRCEDIPVWIDKDFS
jgi:hypothetical protein